MMNRYGYIIITIIIVNVGCFTLAHATSPNDHIEPFSVKEHNVDLYLTAVSFRNGKHQGAEFAWDKRRYFFERFIKGGIKECFNMTARECDLYLHTEYKADLLTTWITNLHNSKESKIILDKLKSNQKVWEFLQKTDGAMHIKIEKDLNFDARIRHEVWVNGENFKILELK